MKSLCGTSAPCVQYNSSLALHQQETLILQTPPPACMSPSRSSRLPQDVVGRNKVECWREITHVDVGSTGLR